MTAVTGLPSSFLRAHARRSIREPRHACHTELGVADEKARNPSKNGACCGVADEIGVLGEKPRKSVAMPDNDLRVLLRVGWRQVAAEQLGDHDSLGPRARARESRPGAQAGDGWGRCGMSQTEHARELQFFAPATSPVLHLQDGQYQLGLEDTDSAPVRVRLARNAPQLGSSAREPA